MNGSVVLVKAILRQWVHMNESIESNLNIIYDKA